VDIGGRTASTARNTDAVNSSARDNSVTNAADTRLPFTNSVASTVRSSDKSRSALTATSDPERPSRTVDKTLDSVVRTENAAVIQNGVEPPHTLNSAPAAWAACDLSIPLQLTSSANNSGGGVPTVTALSSSLSANANSLSRQQEVENCVAQWTTGGDSTQLVVPAVETVSPADSGWYYRDPQGQIQGQY